MKEQNKNDAFISYSHKDSGQIAPVLQNGIENIAKPWWQVGRYRAVYRDVTNLAANPHLWERIVEALNQSKFLILLASPNAATSKWVKKEVEWWLAHKSYESIIIILVQGEINWEEDDFDWTSTTCLPESLKKAFKGEPLYVDLSEYNANGKLDYNESRLKTAIVQIISRITDKPPREIDSEELRANRITRSLRLTAILLLSFLSIVSFILYQNANQERNRAESRLKDIQFLRMKEFIRNAQIFKDADNELGNKKAREMVNNAKNIFHSYATDSTFRKEILKVQSILNIK